MENWNEWSWLVIPLTVWPVCWLFVTMARGADSTPSESTLEKFFRLQREAGAWTWSVTREPKPPDAPSNQDKADEET